MMVLLSPMPAFSISIEKADAQLTAFMFLQAKRHNSMIQSNSPSSLGGLDEQDEGGRVEQENEEVRS